MSMVIMCKLKLLLLSDDRGPVVNDFSRLNIDDLSVLVMIGCALSFKI